MASFSSICQYMVVFRALVVAGNALCTPDIDAGSNGQDAATTPSFYLNIYNPNIQTFAPEYLATSGSVVPTTEMAGRFRFTNYGGLATAEDHFVTLYLSTPTDQPRTTWKMSPSFFEVYTGFSLSTTEHGEVLTWENSAFDGGKARFCQAGSGMRILLNGDAPGDCSLVDLLAYRDK